MPKTKTKKSKLVPGVKTERFRQNAILVVSVLLALVLAATIGLTIRNNNKLNAILEESVKSELLAVCFAARDDIDMELFLSIDSEADIQANQPRFDETIEKLRELKNEVGATYIYALKEIDGKYYFIFDTDEETGTPESPMFDEYELAPVHEDAFAGGLSADIMNVEDEWGSYNTGAIPLFYEGEIVGIVSTDVEDTYIERSKQTATLDAVLLLIVMLVTMALLLGLLIMLLHRNQRMQDNLLYIANHDAITKLYNRYYLFTYLAQWNKVRRNDDETFFALLFVDLDNFKQVNDIAGHERGDDLLRVISQFLSSYTDACTNEGSIECMTARIGGDEFLQIIPNITNPEELEQWARTLLDDFAVNPEFQPFIQDFGVGLSIGGALFPSQTTNYNELIRLADIAMYQAKENGKNNYLLYDESMGNGPEGIVLSVRTEKR
ncbi:MAG: GGDEF domain-containing protein [Coriobacteriales bacterium]|nr:GGDEF domain-containing protein [Coriobacteriales bacterium]